jgi:prepilin-type N-terminal cleavage/methylation domain-containing protein
MKCRVKKNHNAHKAFTLIELVLTIVVISILFSVGSIFMNDSVDTSRYRATVTEMKELTKAIVGDWSVVKGKARTDFGYVGDQGAFPANLAALSGEFTVNAQYTQDAWDTNYVYVANSGGIASIESWGADRANGGVTLAADLIVRFNRDLYLNNTVYVTVYDSRGNILRGNDAGDANYHITGVQLTRLSGVGAAIVQNTPTQGSMFILTAVPMGRYQVQVTVQNTNSYRQFLNDNSATFTEEIAVYPKGAGRMQIINVRLPGALNVS